MSNTIRAILIIIALIIFAAIIYYSASNQSGVANSPNTSPTSTVVLTPPLSDTTSTTTSTSTRNMTIKVALLDPAQQQSGKKRGCDTVILKNFTTPLTTMPLTRSIQLLFAQYEEWPGDGLYNFISRTNKTLSFDRAAIESGVAKIYLTGSLSGLSGVCDNPRAQIQIEETALQFPTVKSVEIYLNGSRSNLAPVEKGA